MIRQTLTTLTASAFLALPSVAQDASSNIVDTAAAAGNFSTLTAAIEQAGLAETLAGDGPFTVFAPTDHAFTAVPAETLDELMADGNEEQLASILTYHVVPEQLMAADLSDGQTLETVNGETLEVSVDGDTLMVGDATVTDTDIEASNGVIHVIDTVMMPEM